MVAEAANLSGPATKQPGHEEKPQNQRRDKPQYNKRPERLPAHALGSA
jgi:hypothetical protein